MAAKILLSLLLLFSLLTSPYSLSTDNFVEGAQILSNSGFLSMSLTLQLLSPNLTTPESQSLTVFSPSDPAFAVSGQPPLSLIQLHFSPLSLSLQSLKSLPLHSEIPTLSPNHSLIITSSPDDDFAALNGVKIDGSPLYDDGSLVIFGIEEFFDPNFQVSRPNVSEISNLECVVSSSVNGSSGSPFENAIELLTSRGYSVMASFLDMQLIGKYQSQSPNLLTVFAPVDDAMTDSVGNFSEYSSLFMRHVVPCKIEWSDLVGFDEGTILGTYLDGFKFNVTRSGDTVMVNDVPVMFPDMYYSDWLVIHGLNQVLLLPERHQEEAESSPEDDNVPDNDEF